MFTCPMVRLAVATQFLIDKKQLIPTKPPENSILEGEFVLPSGLSVSISSSIDNQNKNLWQSIVPEEKFFLSWEYLQAFEQMAPSNIKFYYVILNDGKKNLATFYFQVLHLNHNEIEGLVGPIASETKIHGVGAGIRHWLKKVKSDNGFRLLISGNNFISGEHGIALAKGANPENVFIALAETVKLITDNDRSSGKISAVLVKDYFENNAKDQADFIRKKRYHRFVVEPEMIVPISLDWETFDDYLNALSKKYRNRAKAVFKKTESIIVREYDFDEMLKVESEIFELYKNVHEKAKFKMAILSPHCFTEMKKKFPSIFRFYGYEMKGKLVAFRSEFHLKDHLEAHFIGIDYSENKNIPLYQRILYDYVEAGLKANYKNVFLGRTAAEMKSTVGAVAHNLVCYIRHRNGLSNQVIRPFFDFIQPASWVPRNPFKSEEVETLI